MFLPQPLVVPGAIDDHIGYRTAGVGPLVPDPVTRVKGDSVHNHGGFAVLVAEILCRIDRAQGCAVAPVPPVIPMFIAYFFTMILMYFAYFFAMIIAYCVYLFRLILVCFVYFLALILVFVAYLLTLTLVFFVYLLTLVRVVFTYFLAPCLVFAQGSSRKLPGRGSRHGRPCCGL